MQVGALVRWYNLGVGCGWHHGHVVEVSSSSVRIKTPTGKLLRRHIDELEVLAEPILLRERPLTGAESSRGSAPDFILRERPITGVKK